MLPKLSIPHNPYIFTFLLILPCLTTEEIVGVQRMQRRHEREISDHAIIHYNMTTYTAKIQGPVKKDVKKSQLLCMQAQCNEKISSENSSIHLCITKAQINLK